MNKNKYIGTMVIIAVVVAGVGFFGGMKYDQHRMTAMRTQRTGVAGTNFQGQAGQRPGGTGRPASGMVTGDVLSKDASSITIKIPDGGSRIVLTASSTSVSKATAGTLDDVSVGSLITVQGASNPDGSVTAKSISIRQQQ